MFEFLSRFDGGEIIGILAVVGGCLCGIVAIAGKYWLKIRQVEFKQDMLNRGMSAEDIKTAMDAGTKK